MDVSNTPELLEQHGGFVRGLARALLRDPAQADDVAQEALTRWVTQPPRDASRPRAWFTRVVHGLASNALRAQERRARHEEQAARPERGRSPLEESLQAELVQRVVGAVMELEPAQRDTILARYFRGLGVREFAAESALSEDTVRTRERRALEKLREKLDRRFDERAAWVVGLIRLAEREVAPAPASASPHWAWTPTWIGAASVLALASTAAVVWFALPRGESGIEVAASPGVAEAPQTGAPSPSPSSASTPPARQPVAPSNVSSPARTSADSVSGSASALTVAAAEIHGTFVLEGGAPAAHVAWHLGGVRFSDEDANGSECWAGLQGESAADGAFVARFAPQSGFLYSLTAERQGLARAEWGWRTLEPGRVIELGRVTLVRGATVTGRLVDAAGAPILDPEWSLLVASLGFGFDEGRQDARVEAVFDQSTASFRAEGVMPGENDLHARHRVGGEAKRRLTLAAGETLTLDLVYDGPDNAKRIVIQPSGQPGYEVFDPSGAHLRLVGPDGTSRSAVEQGGLFAPHSFEELAPGAYTAVIDDPHFRPWSRSGISPGTRVKAVLEGCSTLSCRAQGVDGRALALDSLTVQFHGSSLARELVSPATAFDGLVRLVPGDYTLHARAGAFEGEAEVLALGFDETRAVSLTLSAPRMLSGRVLQASGTAVSGAQVLLLRPARQDDSRASPILPPDSITGNPDLFRDQLDAVASGVDGSFAFQLGHGGSYVVYAELANGLCTDTPILSLREGEGRAGIELILPPSASVSGTVRGPGGASCAGLRLWIGPVLESRAKIRQDISRDEHARTLPADGGFRFDGLPAGTIQALLLLPAGAYSGLNGTSGLWNGIELGSFELAVGQALVRDFEGALPGTFTLEVRVNGEPAAGRSIAIDHPYSTPGRPGFRATLDGRGSYGPAPLFPGPWSVSPAGALEPTPLTLTPDKETHLVIDVELAKGSLRFVDATGTPLARRSVTVFASAAGEPPLQRAQRMTDGQGRASFTLAPGAYLVRLDDGARPSPFLEPEQRTVPLTWTAQGPLESEIRF